MGTNHKKSTMVPIVEFKRFAGKWAITVFLLPSLAGFALFYLAPFIWAARYAFFDKSVNGAFVGFGNFIALFNNPSFQAAVYNTARFMGVSVPANVFVSLAFALLISRALGKSSFIRAFITPYILPAAAGAFFWLVFLGDKGQLNARLAAHNISVLFLTGKYAAYSAALINVWKNCGYNIVIYVAAIGQIPADYYDVACLERAGACSIFFLVTLPALYPTVFFVFVISIVNSFRAFREIYMLTGKNPGSGLFMLQHYMNNMFAALNYPRLTGAAYLTGAFIIAVVFIFFLYERKY